MAMAWQWQALEDTHLSQEDFAVITENYKLCDAHGGLSRVAFEQVPPKGVGLRWRVKELGFRPFMCKYVG